MISPKVLPELEKKVREIFAGDSSGHDWFHLDRVRAIALKLAAEEGADPSLVEASALLHDLEDHKREIRPGESLQEVCQSVGMEEAEIRRVRTIVGEVSFQGAGVATPVSSTEGAVVQDADRLDAIGAIGIARAFAFGGSRGRLLYDPDDPPVLHGDFDSYRSSRGATINHFYEKLLLLRDRMNTASARRMAQERHRFMELFLERFLREWEGRL